jgi:hypothetical protein
MGFDVILIPVVALIIISTAVALFILMRKRKKVMQVLPTDLQQCVSPDGCSIPILTSFTGLKGLGTIAFGGNNLNPALILFSDHFMYRVLFRRKALYADIASLRVFRSQFYNRIQLIFKNKVLSFTAVFANEESMQSVIRFLMEKGIRADDRGR